MKTKCEFFKNDVNLAAASPIYRSFEPWYT